MKLRVADRDRQFSALFAEYFRSLEQTLDAPAFSRFAPEARALVQSLSLRGGKRMRVALLHEAAGLVTDQPVAGLDEAALSVELLQTHALILDDIIDDSPTRRGGPSTYYSYRAKLPDHPRAALGLALLAGGLALNLSQQVLMDAPVAPGTRHDMIAIQLEGARAALTGQIADIERDFIRHPDEEVLHSVADYKSARYSALAPLQLGLVTAGEPPARFHAELYRYARSIGISEQMRDDYQDLYGDAATMGKPTGTDIRDGRRNYTVRCILTVATDAERTLVESVLGRPDCTEAEIASVADIGRRHDVPGKLGEHMRRFAHQAAAEAASWRHRWRPEAVAFFERLPVWSLERTI
ncbi:polyprenyl synthetase family protein [Streptomyces sp. NPDC102274]|uniref:polyprenyl synthetase family protein n=1 Tax=Streptomyces sp. NPDC102274 TaxID=3366151 RepID=UPI003827FDCD